MVAPNWPYVAIRVIDYTVTLNEGTEDEFELHRARAFNPGDPVPPSAVIGDPEAGPDAWLKIGRDVKRITK